MEASKPEKSSIQPQTKKNLTNYGNGYNIRNPKPRLMSPTESNESPVSYIRSRTSDLPKVGDALKRMVLSDERCFAAAASLTEYWKNRPDRDILAIRYDQSQQLFVLTHRLDGEFTMTPEKFFMLVAQKTVRLLSQEVAGRIRFMMESPRSKT